MGDHVFISHSSKDKPTADAVCATLEDRGVRCWIAPRDILASDNYGAAITEAVETCAVMVLVLSANSNESHQVVREVVCAAEKRVPIVQFRIEHVTPSNALKYFLIGQQWLDAAPTPSASHLGSLTEAVLRLKEGRGPDAVADATTLPAATTPVRPTAPPAAPQPASTPPGAVALRGPSTAPAFTFEELTRRPELLIGGRVGFYVAREYVGAGGSGMVYVATNERLGRDVCVKVLYPLRARAEAVGTIIARAVRGLAALNHPNVIDVSDFGVYELGPDSSFYLAMDYVRGQTLDEWSAAIDEDPRALARRLRVAFDLASALHAAHTCRYIDEFGMEQRGILHGDVKPRNVLVRPEDRLVLLDFLIVDVQRLIQRELAPGGGDDDRPITADFGTPDFMPPEQRSRGHMTVRGDVYSLGLTFCHLFAPGTPPAAFLQREAADELSPLRELIREMVSYDPEARPRHMKEVAERLALAGAESNITLPESTDYGRQTAAGADPMTHAARRRAARTRPAPPPDARAGDHAERPSSLIERLWRSVKLFVRETFSTK